MNDNDLFRLCQREFSHIEDLIPILRQHDFAIGQIVDDSLYKLCKKEGDNLIIIEIFLTPRMAHIVSGHPLTMPVPNTLYAMIYSKNGDGNLVCKDLTMTEILALMPFPTTICYPNSRKNEISK